MLLFSTNPPLPALKAAAPVAKQTQARICGFLSLIHTQQTISHQNEYRLNNHIQYKNISKLISYSIEASFTVDVLKDGFVQSQLETGFVKHFPLIRVSGDQPVDFHRFALANPVAACLGL